MECAKRLITRCFSLRLTIVFFGLIGLSVMSNVSSDRVIALKFPFLSGEYELAYTRDNQQLKPASQYADRFTIEITSKDKLILRKNGKKQDVYLFSNREFPMVQSDAYVSYHKKNEYYALYYKPDTVFIEVFPLELTENVFVKMKSNE